MIVSRIVLNERIHLATKDECAHSSPEPMMNARIHLPANRMNVRFHQVSRG
jgi:hypothetical protein